ncbi:hypothetical protein Tcan_11313 [Toxocara canis]|uniref:Uncharacterized protein n=1 Tax=Toxocara canis TaxID=6265 RepID=A0A0B2W222_TOXCA|nr:hypothetical protein Tcan_11313 [Toxocara canis]
MQFRTLSLFVVVAYLLAFKRPLFFKNHIVTNSLKEGRPSKMPFSVRIYESIVAARIHSLVMRVPNRP